MKVFLAGRVAVEVDRVLIDEKRFPGRQGRLLFAYLVAEHGRPVPRDELAEALWGESPPPTWEKALTVNVSKLRGLLAEVGVNAPNTLTSAFGCYRLNLPEGTWVDVIAAADAAEEGEAALAADDLEKAKALAMRAVSLARQPFMPGEEGAWVDGKRRELRDILHRALSCLAEASLRAGDPSEARKAAEEAISLEPYRESGYRRLMQAHAAAGNRAEAFRVYERCRKLLAKELGAYPSPETESIYRELLAASPLETKAPILQDADDKRAHGARRFVTLLCADLSGWVAVGERMDPETMHGFSTRYRDEAERALAVHGGVLETLVGGALLAVFGLEVGHEDDALRAVRAALELGPALSGLTEEVERELGVRLTLEIAVNTGDVFAGLDGAAKGRLSGDAVNVATGLEEEVARPGDILIGPETFHLVEHAVVAQGLGAVRLQGRREPVETWRVLGLSERPALFPTSATPFVGRALEVARLEEAFAEATSERSCRLCTLVGPPGIGKSRLAREFVSGLGDRATVLVGRCPSYGTGITYWPLREIVGELAGEEPHAWIKSQLADEPTAIAVAERVAAAVGAGETGAKPEETFWAFRKLFETLARKRPLMLVIDDVHWAEPTLLDLLEQLVAFAVDAPVLVLCLGRPELFETRPEWGVPQPNRSVISLTALNRPEAKALVEQLAGAQGLAEQAQARAVETAEGNPLFLEQLVAFASEGAPDVMPPSIHALLSARVDRLRTGERRVLERGAVQGRTFRRAAVADLLPVEERPTLDKNLLELLRKEFIEALRSDDEFRFRHVLLRDAAYDATAKELRGELHERHADWLDAQHIEDEIVGYHLEQAYGCRAQVGRRDKHGTDLAVRAAERLGRAGRSALKRGDIRGAVNLLARATSLPPVDATLRLQLLPDLAEALSSVGELARAGEVLAEAGDRALAAADVHTGARVRLQQTWLAFQSDPGVDVADVLAEASAATAAFERLHDDRALAHAWHLAAWVHMTYGRLSALADAVQRGRDHARAAGDAMTEEDLTVLSLLVGPTGPLPATDVIREAQTELDRARSTGSRRVEGAALLVLAMCAAFEARFDDARTFLRDATAIDEELSGGRGSGFHYTPAGLIELLAGDLERAERELRNGYETLRERGDAWFLCGVAAELADVLWLQGRDDEALELTLLSEELVAPDVLVAQMMWRGARAKVLARRGLADEAEALAREGVEIIERTEYVLYQADALTDLAEVLWLLGRPEEAAATAAQARRLYEQKGNVAAARKLQPPKHSARA